MWKWIASISDSIVPMKILTYFLTEHLKMETSVFIPATHPYFPAIQTGYKQLTALPLMLPFGIQSLAPVSTIPMVMVSVK